ncbi:MAG TPA: bifunctional folylpolyglutamate synthase/dihydrofolate synthase, partial [Thermodesulfobacteriota bacterium]|nr:bifunctional folylpolyglutamate synthase/dihydrofolate synthase [Thermodesulfobacteriota bacterium]
MGGHAGTESYARVLDYLFGLQRFGIKLGLENTAALLRLLGDPHKRWPAVHIAGTNGKGSTAAFLDSILRSAGFRVGLYTSPHLVSFTERIRVNGAPIPERDVVRLTRQIRPFVEEMERAGAFGAPSAKAPRGGKATITFFEFTTAMAFLCFAEARVHIAILETGMGGRLDATNVVDPVVSAITPISMEHRQYLGNTLLQIAGEKAGIIKPGRPVVTTVRQPQILSLLEEKCRRANSSLHVWGRDFRGVRAGRGL